MSRLIDADAFSVEMKKRQDACKEWTQRTIDNADEENYLRSCGAYAVFVETKLLLENQPTIDAVEVVRGEWIEADDLEGAIKGRVFCSNCKNPFESIVMTNEKIILTNQKTKYCPNCGAKMKGEVE